MIKARVVTERVVEISGGTNKEENIVADNRKEATIWSPDTTRCALPRANPSGERESRETSPTVTVSCSHPASNNNHPVQRRGADTLSHSVTGMKLLMLSAEIRVDAIATNGPKNHISMGKKKTKSNTLLYWTLVISVYLCITFTNAGILSQRRQCSHT